MRYFLSFILFISYLGFAQQLPRKATHGFAVKVVDSLLAAQYNLSVNKGLYVQYVLPKSNAARAGIIASDVLLSINKVPVYDFNSLFKNATNYVDGEKVIYTIYRKGKKINLEVKAHGKPKESAKGIKVEYSSYPFDDGRIRTIYMSNGKQGKKPAILFVPGYTCLSQDNMGINHPYRKLVYYLAEMGFFVMRAEKPGIGDSNNKQQCVEIDFDTEVLSYKKALEELIKHPETDVNNVFVLGHSLGGMEAPFIAKDYNVKGIIAMGITIKHWREYLMEMLRNQIPRLGIDYVQSDNDLKLYEKLLYELLVNKKTPTQMVAIDPDYERILRRDFGVITNDSFLGRNIRFSQSLNNKNLVKAWAMTKAKVLSAWGETDIQVINDFSHRELVRVVNSYHPGNATFLKLKDTDHNFLKIETLEESYRINRGGNITALWPTHFNYDALSAITNWINKISQIKN